MNRLTVAIGAALLLIFISLAWLAFHFHGTIIADATGAGATASGTLTYCQAVLWIDPLLAALDKANNQLLAIRQLDEERKR
jgi:hypothetical protein